MDLETVLLCVIGFFVGLLTRRQEYRVINVGFKTFLTEVMKRGLYVFITMVIATGFYFLIRKAFIPWRMIIWCGGFYLLSCLFTFVDWKIENSEDE
jgi:hypothetical protein